MSWASGCYHFEASLLENWGYPTWKTCANDFSRLELLFDTKKLLSNQVEHKDFELATPKLRLSLAKMELLIKKCAHVWCLILRLREKKIFAVHIKRRRTKQGYNFFSNMVNMGILLKLGLLQNTRVELTERQQSVKDPCFCITPVPLSSHSPVHLHSLLQTLPWTSLLEKQCLFILSGTV